MEGKDQHSLSGSPVQLRGGTGGLIPCPGCLELKPPEKWQGVEIDYDPEAPDPICNDCSTNGIPPRRHTLMLGLPERLALKAYFNCPNPAKARAAAAAASGFSMSHIDNMIHGRRCPEFRRAFQLLLEEHGLGFHGIAKILGEAALADEHKWNPKNEVFDAFPDHRTRVNVAKQATRLQELEPSQKGAGTAAVQVVINHNLGSGEEIDPPGTLRITPKEIDVGSL